MASSFEATTVIPTTEFSLECPFFTRSGYDPESNRYYCDYEPWAYGLFAVACLLMILVPLVVIICCVVRRKNKRRFERRLRSTLSSNTSYSSSEVPYRPLMNDRRKNYGAMENGANSTSGFSPNEESVSENPSQQQDDASTTSSKASLYPNYDQASLDQRNSSAFNPVPRNLELAKSSSQSSKSDISPYAATKLVTDSISPVKDGPSNAASPIYAVLEEPSPKEQNLLGNAEERTPSELRSPEINIVPENNHENVESSALPKETNEEKKPKAERLDDLYTLPEVSYAPNKELNNTLHEELPSTTDSDSRESSPVYNILEPPLPEVEKTPDIVVKPLVEDNINSDKTKSSDDCTDSPESIYTPLLPPKENPYGDASDSTDSGVYQPLTPKRGRLTSRTDYEEFLLEVIKSLPEEERNGAFIVRDSVTNPGSKALTLYNKSLNSEKQIFNFKVCFDDEGQVFLAKSTKRFSNLEQLLRYLRTNKDMLPCTLTNQVN